MLRNSCGSSRWSESSGNWDSYGYARGKNMFVYKPEHGPWTLLPWDIDFVFSSGGDSATAALFGSNEPVMDSFRAFPEFQRAYWRAFEDAANGPLMPATLAARLDPRYTALINAGVPASPRNPSRTTPLSAGPSSSLSWPPSLRRSPSTRPWA